MPKAKPSASRAGSKRKPSLLASLIAEPASPEPVVEPPSEQTPPAQGAADVPIETPAAAPLPVESEMHVMTAEDSPAALPVEPESFPAYVPVEPVAMLPPPPRPDRGGRHSDKPPVVRDWYGLISMGIIGMLAGVVLTLLILAALNKGTLILNQQQEIRDLTNRVSGLEGQVAGLETSTESLRKRLEALEGLPGRMDQAEAALSEMAAALDKVEADTAALGTRADKLEKDVAAVRAAADRFTAFLDGLRDLLSQTQATPAPEPTAVPAPSNTPPPTRTPWPTSTPATP